MELGFENTHMADLGNFFWAYHWTSNLSVLGSLGYQISKGWVGSISKVEAEIHRTLSWWRHHMLPFDHLC